ncbi:MAG: acyl-protein synthetase [Gammaproteobacteria bacterium]|nr:MAG: acyl-protein synthetase [Gammaproteobacteria bacterium]
MKVSLPLQETTVSEKIGIMEEIWSDLSRTELGYSPPDWHGRILEERRKLGDSGEVGFTDWETAKKEINDRDS